MKSSGGNRTCIKCPTPEVCILHWGGAINSWIDISPPVNPFANKGKLVLAKVQKHQVQVQEYQNYDYIYIYIYIYKEIILD